MIFDDGKKVVFLPTIDYGDDNGGIEVISIHDTYAGASKALRECGFRPTSHFTSLGERYAFEGKTADDYPYAYIDEVEVRP